MQRGNGGLSFEIEEERRDRELTLGPSMLALLAVALVGLCALCFVAGYGVGHRSPAEQIGAQTGPTGPSAAQLFSSQPKPSATQNSSHSQAESQPAADANAAVETGENVGQAATSVPPAPAAVVQTALPAQSAAQQPIPAAVQAVQPALPQSGAWMVQIAAVSHAEDADVLVSALRKRGYGVSVRHDPLDNLLHVQVGPFPTHSDATGMRQRLLTDGYNAIVQP